MTGGEFGGVDIDLLADYIGGVLTGTPEESVVAARIATDQAWREAYASLHDGMALVSAELGRFEPEPMPADLAARLDAALTGRPVERDSAEGRPGFLDLVALSADADAWGPDLGADASSWGTDRGADPNASGTDLGMHSNALDTDLDANPNASGTGVGARDVDGEPGGEGMRDDPDATGAASRPAAERRDAPEPIGSGSARPPATHLTLVHGGRAGGEVPDPVREEAPPPVRGRRLRWAAPIAVAAGVIAFVGFGADYLAGRSGHSTSDSAGSAVSADKRAQTLLSLAPEQMLSSGVDYTHATLGTTPLQPETAPLASPKGFSSAPERHPSPAMAAGAAPAPGLQRLIAPAALEGCLTAIENANGNGVISVETVDFARFAGKPAVIVRFTAANGRWAWASGADCGTHAGGAATLDKVPVG